MEVEPPRGRVLCFNPQRIIEGIQFHLTEECKTCALTPDSRRNAIDNLASRIRFVTISTDEWEAMDNLRRLQWLLNVSHMTVHLTPRGSAILSVG